MPFLKHHLTAEPRSRQIERKTFKNGLRHAVFNIIGDYYKGEWVDNAKQGKGALTAINGKLYEGDWNEDLRHGHGIFSNKLPNENYETLYVGEWYKGKKQGKGTSHFPDGGSYEGSWYNGKRHGCGRMWFLDGSFYDGQWAYDKFHGYGLYVYSHGNRYEGEWSSNKKNGHGKYYHLDSGQVQEGLWYDDWCVCSTMKDIMYRQTAVNPTIYPIQKIELKDPDHVCDETEENFGNKLLDDEIEVDPPLKPCDYSELLICEDDK